MDCTVYIRTIIFDIPLLFAETDYFRKAVCSVVRKLRTPLLQAYIAPDLFYNHDDGSGHPINRYPLVQYKVINGCAAITGINQGATALWHFLQLLRLPHNLGANAIHIHGKEAGLHNYEEMPVQEHTIRLLQQPAKYAIEKWLALEEENYARWMRQLLPQRQAALLNEVLLKQISFFLRGAGYSLEITYEAGVTAIPGMQWLREFNVHKLAFDGTFYCNLSLPAEIGIGQVPSIGFGRISPVAG